MHRVGLVGVMALRSCAAYHIKKKGAKVFQLMKLEKLIGGEDSEPAGRCYKLAGTHFRIRKIKFR
jgi:hypothetical protein